MIAQGHAMVASLIRRNQPGPYQLQAAINAVHTDAPSAADTDWEQILQLYDQLVALSPTPIVALNRAVALAEVHGASDGLAAVDGLDLDDYFLFHSTRAELLRRPRSRRRGRRRLRAGPGPRRQRGGEPILRAAPAVPDLSAGGVAALLAVAAPTW